MAPEIIQKVLQIPWVLIGEETFVVTRSNGLVNTRHVVAIDTLEEEFVIRYAPPNHFARVALCDAEEAPEKDLLAEGGIRVPIEPDPAS